MSDGLINSMLEALTPDIYERFKTAIELKRWPNGEPLTQEQLDTCMQAVVAYEYKHLPKEQRTGYVPPKSEPCADTEVKKIKPQEETPIQWR